MRESRLANIALFCALGAVCACGSVLVLAGPSLDPSLGDPVSDVPPWRQSLLDCWTNASCVRALIVSHGGDWGLDYPYDSFPAFQRAINKTSDSVKGDFRVSSDNIGMVMHSSPVEWYESPSCTGVVVENTPAAKLEQCTMALTNYTFISVPDLLAWMDGRGITMLCVKRAQDIPRAISTVIENNAQNRTFLEIKIPDLLEWVPQSPGWEQVYYMAEGTNLGDLQSFLTNASATLLRQSFTFEFSKKWQDWGVNVTQVIRDKLHPLNIRSMAKTPTVLPSVQDHETLWEVDGFDVVYTYDTDNAIIARTAVDEARGVNPP